MSGVGLENGYTRIANELMQAIASAGLTGQQRSVLDAIIHKTYGYHKKTDDISLSQISKYCGVSRSGCSMAIAALTDMQIITRAAGKRGQILGINKHLSRWTPRTKRTPPVPVTGTPKTVPVTGTAAVGVPVTGTEVFPLPEQKCSRYRNDIVPVTGTTKETRKLQKKLAKEKNTAPGATPAGLTTETWAAYSVAYHHRYGVEPVRNASVNGKLAQFVKRVGAPDAPRIAAYFVGLNNRWYVQKGHAVGSLLNDAEQLATAWKTNQSITETRARQVDKTQTTGDVFRELMQEAKDA